MRVAVFGGAGFLGSHVADALTASGHDVIVFDVKDSPYVQGTQRKVRGSILDFEAVQQAVRGCDVVYNFAGLSDIEEANARPLDAVQANILGNTMVL
ncbi:MAG: NAD-dependent epimerase/dehydratase family protein, partial [Nitrospiraceae bacterium]